MNKPQILIDDEIFIRQRFGGVSRIFIEILKARNHFDEAEISFENLYSESFVKKANPFLEKQLESFAKDCMDVLNK